MPQTGDSWRDRGRCWNNRALHGIIHVPPPRITGSPHNLQEIA